MKKKLKVKRVEIRLNVSDYALLEKYCNLYCFTYTKLVTQLLRSLEKKNENV